MHISTYQGDRNTSLQIDSKRQDTLSTLFGPQKLKSHDGFAICPILMYNNETLHFMTGLKKQLVLTS